MQTTYHYTDTLNHLVRLPKDSDLLQTIKNVCEEKSITSAVLSGIGALQHATLSYYDQHAKKYEERFFDQHMEIISLNGNVSLREGEVFVHIHVGLSTETFEMIGGHVMPDTKVFACELHIAELKGENPVRKYDDATGLYLWEK